MNRGRTVAVQAAGSLNSGHKVELQDAGTTKQQSENRWLEMIMVMMMMMIGGTQDDSRQIQSAGEATRRLPVAVPQHRDSVKCGLARLGSGMLVRACSDVVWVLW